jgi:membrane protein YqaA with SNARE-associated domain
MNLPISEAQARVALAAVAAVCAFLLVQPDVAIPPILKVVLGAIIVALAVINPSNIVSGLNKPQG